MVLVLFETAAGLALFKVLDESKIQQADLIQPQFETSELACNNIKLQAFKKFENTASALEATTAMVEGKVSKPLKKLLTEEMIDKKLADQLVIADPKLASAVAKKMGIQVMPVNAQVNELFRGIRNQLAALISGIGHEEAMNNMTLGLSHSLSRYKLKFSPDKVDTMIVQAVGLLDELDKELNTYSMRVKEWYGWHFPELAKIIVDNVAYSKIVSIMGFRTNASSCDALSTILPEELEHEVRQAAEISTGTEISDEDLMNIQALSAQVISLHQYRQQLNSYLSARMNAIAPNLTVLVGELVGARLIAHAGSLMTLAKYPASTVQILGAEKALFRALKTKKDTPKYGLLFHASLVGQAVGKNKGKIARVLAAKTALSIRLDALSEDQTMDHEFGVNARALVERRVRDLNQGGQHKISNGGGKKTEYKKHAPSTNGVHRAYNPASDMQFNGPPSAAKKRKFDDVQEVQSVVAVVEPVIASVETDAEPVAKKHKKESKKEAKDESKEEKKARKEAKKSSSKDVDGEGAKKKKKESKKEKKVSKKVE